MKSDGLSPDQLPLEFLGREEWSDGLVSPRDMASWKLESLRISRPEAMFSVHDGTLEGEDLLMATMTLADAKVRCTSLPNCVGFYSEDSGHEADTAVDWHFKAVWSLVPCRPGAIAYQKERASPLFTRHQGYSLDGADLQVSELTVEAAKRVCADLEDCMGFDIKGDPSGFGTGLVHFKSGMQLVPDATGNSTCYVFQTETRSHALPADGAAFYHMITEGDEKVEEPCLKSETKSSKSDAKSFKSDLKSQKS